MTVLLQVKALSVAYDGVTALDGIDLTVAAGEIRALLGANGAGKTTLLRTIMGLVPATGGEVFLDGAPVMSRSPEARARRGLAYCPEGRRLFPGLTVRENLEVAAFAGARERRRRMDRVMTLFPQLGTRTGGLAWQLSGGQQQMLAIGRALMAAPRLLLLDEPSVGLAGGLVTDLMGRLRDVAASGTGVLLAEQNAAAALAVAPKADVLRAGRIVWSGAAKNLNRDVMDDVFLGV